MGGFKVPDEKIMLRGNCFVVTILSHNISITWVVRKKIILSKAED